MMTTFSPELIKKSKVVKWSELSGKRWDPTFYFNAVKIFNSYNFNTFTLNRINCSIVSGFGAGKDAQVDADDGYLHIRPTNISNDGHLIYDKNIYVSNENNNYTLHKGDVLFNNTNSQDLVGKTAYFDIDNECLFSNHITRIRLYDDTVLPKYLWILLNVLQNKKLFFSICTNWNNQSGVGIELLKQIPLPLAPKSIQKQIIKVFEAAYVEKTKKEKDAQKALDSIDDYLLHELGIILTEKDWDAMENRLYVRKWSDLSGNRYDPDYYKDKYKNLISSINLSKYKKLKLKTISLSINNGTTPSKKLYAKENTKYPIIKVSSYTKNYIDLKKVEYSKKPIGNCYASESDIFILSSAHQSDYVGKFIKYLKEEPLIKTSFVGELIRIKVNKKLYNPTLLYSLLNTDLYKTLLNREKRGQTSHIYPSDIGEIILPIPDIDIQDKIVENLINIFNSSDKLKKEASEIVDKAKKQVENILLG